MRHLVLALMIALLPLRGWVGNAMAMPTMATPMAVGNTADAAIDTANATKNIAENAQPERVASNSSSGSLGMQQLDCPGHTAHAMHAGGTQTSGALDNDAPASNAANSAANGQEHGQGGCSDCQLCHAVAMLGMGIRTAVLSPAPLRPAAKAPAWRSAELQTGFKPPIS